MALFLKRNQRGFNCHPRWEGAIPLVTYKKNLKFIFVLEISKEISDFFEILLKDNWIFWIIKFFFILSEI